MGLLFLEVNHPDDLLRVKIMDQDGAIFSTGYEVLVHRAYTELSDEIVIVKNDLNDFTSLYLPNP